MPQFRLTHKYAKDCQISTLSQPQAINHPLDDWFIDIIRINRKKIAIATHAQSTFTLFIPYAEVGGAKEIPENIGILLKIFLQNHGLSEWSKQVEILFSEPITFCKTVDKKILGHMNDFKWCAASYIDDSPGCLHPIDWNQVANRINTMPVNFSLANQFIFPIEMLGKLIGCSLKAKEYM